MQNNNQNQNAFTNSVNLKDPAMKHTLSLFHQLGNFLESNKIIEPKTLIVEPARDIEYNQDAVVFGMLAPSGACHVHISMNPRDFVEVQFSDDFILTVMNGYYEALLDTLQSKATDLVNDDKDVDDATVSDLIYNFQTMLRFLDVVGDAANQMDLFSQNRFDGHFRANVYLGLSASDRPDKELNDILATFEQMPEVILAELEFIAQMLVHGNDPDPADFLKIINCDVPAFPKLDKTQVDIYGRPIVTFPEFQIQPL